MARFDTLLDLLFREEWRRWPDLPASDPLLDAAAALGGGEPKRAVAVLDSATVAGADDAAVGAALRYLAAVMEHNWYPGGAGAPLSADALSSFAAVPDLAADHLAAVVVVIAARRLVGSASAWRSMVESGGPEDPGVQSAVFGPARALLDVLRDAGQFRVAAPNALLLADLLVRAGAEPTDILEHARTMYAGDAGGLAACRLLELDLALPGGRPELLGETLDGLPGPAGGPAEPGLAERYAELAAEFEAAGSARGAAAVALRRSRLALPADPDRAAELLDAAVSGAAESGDAALARLAEVHRALLRLELGDVVDTTAVAQPIIKWAGQHGSTSFARGLARLCSARAERWREDGIVRARRAALLGRAIATGVGATPESSQTRRERSAQYGAPLYGRAALRLSLRELTSVFPPGGAAPVAPLDVVDWARLIDNVVAVQGEALAVADPDGLLRIRDRLGWLTEHTPADPQLAAAVATLQGVLAEMTIESLIEVPRYEGHAAVDAGDADLATAKYEHALTVARQAGSPIVATVLVLATLRRFDEAADLIEAAWTGGTLPADLAAPLFARVDRFDRAREALDQLPAEDERSWAEPELRARVALGTGRLDAAIADAELAVRRFDDRLARLARDVLRTQALNSLRVAELYTTAIRAHVALTANADRSAAAQHLAAAFALSDRARGMVLADILHDMITSAADPATVAAAGAWEHTGAELVRVIEELAAAEPDRADPARLAVAESALDDAEAAFVTQAPTLFAERARLPDPVALPAVQELLHQHPDVLLVQYHLARPRELVIFTVTADGAEVHTVRADIEQLIVQVRRFHGHMSSFASTPAQRAPLGAALADLLLAPIADAVAAHDRLVIVPHGVLAMLPFHVLPWSGDDLGAVHELSYLPATAVLLNQRPAAPASGAPLIVGDPEYSAPGPRPLPGTGVEAHAIAAMRHVDPLVGPAAGREAVLSSLAAAPVLHMGTHGFLTEAAPYSSYLALAGSDRLTVPDLVGVQSRTELVVLSACDSGRGQATAAGDVIGLTRALLGAGVRGVVASLWPVNDVFACLIMVEFHRRLLAGEGPTTALAGGSAMLRTLTRTMATQRYRELATAHGLDPDRQAALRTDRIIHGPSRTDPDPAHPSAYAPFFYAGAW